jgi:hypothetical protein
MLATALTLTGATVNSTYGLRSITDGKSIRSDATAPLGSPHTVTVSHSLRNAKDPESALRHLFRLDWTGHNSVTGLPEVASMYIVVELPQSTTFSSADLTNMQAQLFNGVAGNWSAFLNSEP